MLLAMQGSDHAQVCRKENAGDDSEKKASIKYMTDDICKISTGKYFLHWKIQSWKEWKSLFPSQGRERLSDLEMWCSFKQYSREESSGLPYSAVVGAPYLTSWCHTFCMPKYKALKQLRAIVQKRKYSSFAQRVCSVLQIQFMCIQPNLGKGQHYFRRIIYQN